MIRRLVNQILRTALSELFLGNVKDTVQMSLGSDLFTSSNVQVNDLIFRPDILDACLHPLKLVWGRLGKLQVEGIAEVALGAPIKVVLENVFLLFTVSDDNNAEYLHILRKIFLELQSKAQSFGIIKNLLRRILGMSIDKALDSQTQRKIIFTAIKHVFKVLPSPTS